MSAWTYLLLSEHGDVYLGATTRIRKRLREHNGPEKGHHTSGKKWHLLAVRRFDSRKEAFDFEGHLKKKRWDQKIIWELQCFDRVCKLVSRHGYAFTPSEWLMKHNLRWIRRVFPDFPSNSS